MARNIKRKKEYDRQYRRQDNLLHPEEKRQRDKQWRLDNPIYMSQWRQTSKGKESGKKHNAKRRNFGFFPLNDPFDGCEAHHISQNFVVYMPKEVHRSISHCLETERNMEQINKLAIEFI